VLQGRYLLMTDEDAWAVEERLWTGGEAYFAKAIDPACLMIFPGAGVLDAEASLDGLKAAPRWQSVEMDARRVTRPADGLIVLAYRARGHREGQKPYEAWCGSSYRFAAGEWRLFQHQQTPV
jgi:hypothetical protein